MTPADFRARFPEFASDTLFPDSQIEFWFSIAEQVVSEKRWGKLREQGMALFVAHNLMLGVQAQAAAASGGVPSALGSAISSKSVGSVSVSYDNGMGAEDGGGQWNMTSYGRRYIDLVRTLIGQGCYQL